MSRRYVVTRTEMNGKHPLVCAVYEDHQMLEVNCIPQEGAKSLWFQETSFWFRLSVSRLRQRNRR